MKQAEPSDLEDVLALLYDRAAWLRQQGSNQWNTSSTFRQSFSNFILNGETWLLIDETKEQAVGTVTITTERDLDFWSAAEIQTPAIYISKIATRIDRGGEGLGEMIISWCRDFAMRRGMEVVRWDAWSTNARLHTFYRGIGAQFVRTAGDDFTAALFEIPARFNSQLPILTQCSVCEIIPAA
ncbi:hypothetical protein BDV12DRAFT_178363 [Aspergillus spectabilis]